MEREEGTAGTQFICCTSKKYKYCQMLRWDVSLELVMSSVHLPEILFADTTAVGLKCIVHRWTGAQFNTQFTCFAGTKVQILTRYGGQRGQEARESVTNLNGHAFIMSGMRCDKSFFV